jgi:hypothetical protein
MNNFIYFFKRKIWQIKNVFKWLPVIWNQYDFDYNYPIDVFKFQLGKLADFMESDKAYTVNAHRRAAKIRTAIKLMDKVYNEEYSCEYQDKIKELYGEYDTIFVPIPGSTSSTMERVWSKQYTKEELENIEQHETQLFKESQEKQKRAHKLLWDFIEHNIQGWWD